MKKFRDIMQGIKAPSTSDLRINNEELKYYTSNGSSMEGALLQLRSNPQVSTL